MKLLEILFYLFLIALPLGTRVLVYQFTPGFHEYESISLYANDVFLILFLIIFLVKDRFQLVSWRIKPKFPFHISHFTLIFIFFAFLSIFFATSTGLAIYNFARLGRLVGFAFAAGKILAEKKVLKRALATIAVLAVIQSGIGFLQFKNQGALGLKWLGESPISVFDGGTSKILVYPDPKATMGVGVEGSRVVRAYGTFPHPNILAAFLILGLFSLCYFWLVNFQRFEWKKSTSYRDALHMYFPTLTRSLIYAVGIFIVLLGLVLTFSRSAWLITLIISLASCIIASFSKDNRLQALKLFFVLVTSLLFIVFSLSLFVLPRATISTGEPAVTYRLRYNELA